MPDIRFTCSLNNGKFHQYWLAITSSRQWNLSWTSRSHVFWTSTVAYGVLQIIWHLFLGPGRQCETAMQTLVCLHPQTVDSAIPCSPSTMRRTANWLICKGSCVHSQCLHVFDTSKMWWPQSQKLLFSNKNHLFISALPLNCSPITIVKSMDHTCLGRNGSISTCFPECAKHRWRDLCRPNVTNLLCRWHQQFLLQFPSHGQLQGLLGPNTWEMWMGVWHRSKIVILNLQPMDVVLSWRFLSSKEGTCSQVCAFVPLYSRLFETLLRH